MQFLADIIVAILAGYLAFTNMLADGIAHIIEPEVDIETVFLEEDTDEERLQKIETAYGETHSLPDILIENAAYQSAAVGGSVRGATTSSDDVQDTLVNIYCTYKTDEFVRTTTGTGFFIDPAGVVMTNAHVAQFLLLETVNETGETECILRGGNPAVPLYEAELLYISPAWIQKHAHLIDAARPQGTGERDFALLYVSGGVDNKPMPGRFPFLSLDTSLLTMELMGKTITAAGYPAGGIADAGPNADLIPVVAETNVTDMFTFNGDYADVIAIADSAVGYQGASGGPVLNADGDVIGLITTRGSETEGEQSLRAITLSYIDRTMIEESTFNIAETATGQLAFRAKLFTETIVPFLSRVLESELE